MRETNTVRMDAQEMMSGDAARVSMSEPSLPTLHSTTTPYRIIRDLNLTWLGKLGNCSPP